MSAPDEAPLDFLVEGSIEVELYRQITRGWEDVSDLDRETTATHKRPLDSEVRSNVRTF